MNILIISSAFFPENSPRSLRTTELASELSRQGHNVKVITHDSVAAREFCSLHKITLKPLSPLTWRHLNISGNGLTKLFVRAIVRFSNLFFAFPEIQYIKCVKYALKGEEGYDLLISIAYPFPIHWAVSFIRTSSNRIARIWVADCGDPFMKQKNDTFAPPFYFSFLEKKFCRSAEFISIPFEGALKGYYKEFYPKIKIIPQGLSFPKITTVYKPSEIVHFAYAGNIRSYLHYAIPFFNFILNCPTNFRFIVYTKDPELYRQYLSGLELSRLHISDYISREALLNALNEVDFFVHFPYRHEIQRSLKLVDYSYLRKPVLSFKNDEESILQLKSFLNRDFSSYVWRDEFSDYQIDKVAQQFTDLVP